jgi:hypothetical protein
MPAEAMTITELTGSRRSVILRDRALPHRPVAWPGEQRQKKTSYPGNPVSTVQILGTVEPDLEMGGAWKTKFIGQMVTLWGFDDVVSRGADVTAENMVEIFTRIRRGGNLLRVSWGPEVRRGILATFEPNYDRVEDILWSARFVWTQIGDAPAPRASEAAEPETDLNTDLTALNSVLASQPSYILPGVAVPIGIAAAAVQEATLGMAASLGAISGVPDVTLPQFQGIAQWAETIQTQGTIMRALTSDRSLELFVATDDVGSVFGAGLWRRDVAAAALALMASAIEARESIRDRVIAEFQDVDVVRDGETLRDVSLRQYGTSDAWGLIADANGYVTSDVAAGTSVLIPRRSTSTAGAAA